LGLAPFFSFRNSMIFRIADNRDIQNIANLHSLSWQKTYRGAFTDDFLDNHVQENRLSVWTQRLQQPLENQIVIICEIDNSTAGFVCAFGDKDEQFGTYIDNLHVSPDFKGKGIGQALMKQIAKWSIEIYNQPKIYLKVLENNYAAIGFYDKMGGVNHSTFPETMEGGNIQNICLYVWKNFIS
jgi:ribosomal protein S18 acetylase RimI-like enzyme